MLIFVISIILYIVAIVMTYHNVYNLEKINRIKLIVLGFISTFIITLIVCMISSSSINSEYLPMVKKMTILLFSPINAIIILPYTGNILNKYKEKKIDKKILKKKFLILVMILVIIFIFEIGYIKDFENGLITNAMKRTNA